MKELHLKSFVFFFPSSGEELDVHVEAAGMLRENRERETAQREGRMWIPVSESSSFIFKA